MYYKVSSQTLSRIHEILINKHGLCRILRAVGVQKASFVIHHIHISIIVNSGINVIANFFFRRPFHQSIHMSMGFSNVAISRNGYTDTPTTYQIPLTKTVVLDYLMCNLVRLLIHSCLDAIYTVDKLSVNTLYIYLKS